MIKLLDKPVPEWTELEAVIESIKMWRFLAEDGKRTKDQYFEQFGITGNQVTAKCFLCEYYFHTKAQERVTRYPHKDMRAAELCVVLRCCLSPDKLCHFAAEGSSFSVWYETDNETETEICRRQSAAEKILSAIEKRYKQLTGENYHE